jgi:LacI family transcriptional regulator
MATIRDVAKMAGVSKSTVSLAFNHPTRVNAETLERIQQASHAVGYAADPLAQTLARGRSRIIGMIVGDISVPFFSNVLREVERSAVAAGYFVVVADSASDAERELALLDHFVGMRVAGVVLSPSGTGDDYLARLSRLKMPVVCFDNKIEGLDTDFVGSDNQLASAMLTEHLLRLGHRRIAFLEGTQDMFTADQRLLGFRATMSAGGAQIEESLVVRGEYEADIAYAEVMRLMTRPDRPSAIIAANSVMGMAALQAIQELGFRCPEQISLAMIDDTTWSNVITPKPTMVVQDTLELGRTVARRLFERILHPDLAIAPPKVDFLSTRFVPGQSCSKLEA